MSNHKNLVFFNKEGDSLNFNYNNSSDRFEGDILFHKNSSDTFKTFGLYTMEDVPSIEFELPGELTTKKFQLFNEYGLHFYGSKYENENITKIEPVNNDPNFYSKWIYGVDFESKFPVGSLVKFEKPFLEFNNTNKSYTVISSKKNAIMIISQIDNKSFESSYFSDYTDINNYTDDVTISGINAIGVYNYIDSLYNNKLSEWSEPNFYDDLYNGRKLNVLNTNNNNNTITVDNVDLTDQVNFEFRLDKDNLPDNSNLIVEVITKTDLPKLYNGNLNITSEGKIYLSDYPVILKPGTEFKIVGSQDNQNFLTVSPIPRFENNTQLTYYATQSQVLYNNRVYECVQAYTQSYSDDNTAFITPENTDYWDNASYIKVNQALIDEPLTNAQLYLTTDRYYFEYEWNESSEITLSSFTEKYKEELKLFKVDTFYEDDTLKMDLIYPSDYAKVNFYHTELGPTYSIGTEFKTFERLIEVEEILTPELNYDFCENYNYNLIFTDIDEYGIKIEINGMVYDEEVSFIYSGSMIDMERTIDRTLRNWLSRWYLRLLSLGIVVELKYIGNYTSVFYNSINFKTEYPNVPLIINEVRVGTTAEYFIEHSDVLFDDMGPFLTFTINDKEYSQQTVYNGSTPDIIKTLSNWKDEHEQVLNSYGIYIENINNLIKFRTKDLERRLDYSISTGKINLPGLSDYIIIPKMEGSLGSFMTSNEILLPEGSTFSFEEEGFATGMVVSINNNFYPWVNQEFNIQFLDPQQMNLSYEGPFWGLTDSICNSSAYVTIAFDNGYGQTGCQPINIPQFSGEGGPFSKSMFSSAFSITYNANTYVNNTYDLNSLPGTSNLVDIKYIQLSNSIYCYGDGLVVMDSYLGEYLETIELTGNTQSIEMEFNPVNNYIYCLSKNQISIVNPLVNQLVYTIPLTDDAYDIEINSTNGDVYVTYQNSPKIDIWYYNNFIPTPNQSLTTPSASDTMTGMMVFNEFENDMYVTTDDDLVIRVDGSTRTIQTSYNIPGLTHSIFYEPVNESIYVYGDTNLWKIDNGVTQSVSLSSQNFTDIIFNNLTGEMNISDSSTQFTRLNLDNDTYNQTGIGSYGYLTINQFDGDVYMSSLTGNVIYVIDATNGSVKHTAPMSAQTTKIIYNPDRKSVWTIQPSSNSIVEVEVELGGTIDIETATFSSVGDNLYGTLDENYEERPSIWLKSKEYIRRPRENFEGENQVKYYWKWLSDNVPSFFMYDFSGEQLDRVTTGSYSYTGPRPLDDIYLNRKPNKDISKVDISKYQQTIFDQIVYDISYIDDEDDISVEPTPLELFLGFNSNDEGALRSILQLYKKEEIEFTISSDNLTNIDLETLNIDNLNEKVGKISIGDGSTETFTNKGLKPEQHIVIYIKDKQNDTNQYLSENNGLIVKVKEVYTKELIVDFFNLDVDLLEEENTVLVNYPNVGDTTYLDFSIKVIDREIGRFNVYGETEIEDIRFKNELRNVGKLINPEDVYIFKEYDILEGGVDWTYVNTKRKEMLMMKDIIYPYIGSYKSIINAINYFGYNDLQLNEYYRNVNEESDEFSKLFKVEIPDIFDNSVEGWTENDFIKNTYPNENYEETNLFNLTYFITDKQGNNILEYSVDEIIIKLQGLKYWLKRNIIPLTHNIKDIIGKAYFTKTNSILHKVIDVTRFNMKQEITPVTFKLNEAYLSPIKTGSTVYNCVLDFYSIIPGIGTEIEPNINIDEKPKPYNGSNLEMPDYFNIKIRTYKTYKEWAPFSNYNKGDRVIYYDVLWESVIDDNKTNNPRKFENVEKWVSSKDYKVTNIVEFDRNYYVYTGNGDPESTSNPYKDSDNWNDITEWKRINYEPVQTINEFRKGDDLKPFNFTLDSNLDPFITIELTTDNGYGQIYSDRKNYEIRGIKDLIDDSGVGDTIGPFEPIEPVY
jgi:hypothetical protein